MIKILFWKAIWTMSSLSLHLYVLDKTGHTLGTQNLRAEWGKEEGGRSSKSDWPGQEEPGGQVHGGKIRMSCSGGAVIVAVCYT